MLPRRGVVVAASRRLGNMADGGCWLLVLQGLNGGKAVFRLYNDRAGRQVRNVGSNRFEHWISGL